MKILIFLIPILFFSSVTFPKQTIEENTDKAVLIGVARYEHMGDWLYNDDDAYRLYAFLSSYHFSDDNLNLLIDEDAGNENIINKLTKSSELCTANDNFFFYFAGHSNSKGILGYNGTYENIVKYEEIGKILKTCKAKHKLLIFNAAYSDKAKTAFDENTTVWFGGNEGEETPEYNDLRQTLFAHFIIRGLKGAADANDDTIVSLEEVRDYTYDNVRFYTENQQNPVMINYVTTEWNLKNLKANRK